MVFFVRNGFRISGWDQQPLYFLTRQSTENSNSRNRLLLACNPELGIRDLDIDPLSQFSKRSMGHIVPQKNPNQGSKKLKRSSRKCLSVLRLWHVRGGSIQPSQVQISSACCNFRCIGSGLIRAKPCRNTARLHAPVPLARIIYDSSSRNRQAALRERRAEPGGPEAYSCSTSRDRGASPSPEGLSQQRIGDCSRRAHE
jgi:hypothetical protein